MSYGVIYKITNIENGMCYIGATVNPKTRLKLHEKKFNPINHIFQILAEYDSIEELEAAERYWIKYYNSIKNGYNKTKGGSLKPSTGKTTITIPLSIDNESLEKFNEIVKKEYTDKSKLLRKWINEYSNKSEIKMDFF